MIAHDLHIRPFEERDQESVRWLILEGLGEHFGHIDESYNPDLNNIRESYITPGHVFLVACIGDEIVGTGALVKHTEDTVQMVRISTSKAYRRRGIGRAVTERLLREAQEQGARRIIVETNLDWYDAIRLYKRLGFEEYQRSSSLVFLNLLLAPAADKAS